MSIPPCLVEINFSNPRDRTLFILGLSFIPRLTPYAVDHDTLRIQFIDVSKIKYFSQTLDFPIRPFSTIRKTSLNDR